MSNTSAPMTLQQAYDRECVQIAEAYSTLRVLRRKLRESLKRREMIMAESAQVDAVLRKNAVKEAE